MTEKYALNWHQFSEHLDLMFKDLYQEGRYSDVTLVSDDQTQFKAHRIVLSACSPIFKKIIDSNPSQHPLIYLRGIQSYEMESILQFMYLGEGKFYRERMGEFIKVAKDLEVKDISDGMEIPGEEDSIEDETTVNDIDGSFLEGKNEEHGENYVKTEAKINIENCEVESRTKIEVDGFEDKIKVEDFVETLEKGNHTQTQRPYLNKKSRDVKTQCPECKVVYSSMPHMMRHYRSKHQGIKYLCNMCGLQVPYKDELKYHINSKHEGIKYPCNLCDYQAILKVNLKRHIQSEHEGVRYPCTQCDYRAARKDTLLKHMRSLHDDPILQCDSCDYRAARKDALQKHMRSFHSDAKRNIKQ